ncbi:hypothetical protein EX30DRAFT_375341 [Ascodesmis nigricans]|uniref:Uncharacterized protein n=1 Tax=Ascodesmis nigricans TaxID=341454 RepID=A0A4S2MIS8_9PEZI|nr:hypothetical protein EX30DRAFT_375341 [Ascodesmis nigricans]
MHLFTRLRAPHQAPSSPSTTSPPPVASSSHDDNRHLSSPSPTPSRRTRRSNSDITGHRPHLSNRHYDPRLSTIPLGFDLMFGASHPRARGKYSPSPSSTGTPSQNQSYAPSVASYSQSLERVNTAGSERERGAPSPIVGHGPSTRGLGLQHMPLFDGIPTPAILDRHPSNSSSIHTTHTSDPAYLRDQIQRLQTLNRDLESELSDRMQRINGLRQSHAAVMDSLRESQQQEVAALKKTMQAQADEITVLRKRSRRNEQQDPEKVKRLEALVKEKDEELDAVKTANESLRDKVRGLEAGEEVLELRSQLQDEIRRREAADRIAEAKARAEMELVLKEERRKMQEEIQAAASTQKQCEHEDMVSRETLEKEVQQTRNEGERRIQDLNWMYNTSLDKWEQMRAELEKAIDQLQRQTAELNERNRTLHEEIDRRQQQIQQQGHQIQHLLSQPPPPTSPTSPTAQGADLTINEELVGMVKKLTTRLAEEKKKNRQLETTVNDMTEKSLSSVSTAQHDLQKMKSELEDRTTELERVTAEVKGVEKERNEFRDAWNLACTELDEAQKKTEMKERRVAELEGVVEGLNNEVQEVKRRMGESQEQVRQTQKRLEEEIHNHQMSESHQHNNLDHNDQSDVQQSDQTQPRDSYGSSLYSTTPSMAPSAPNPYQPSSPPLRNSRRPRPLSTSSTESGILPPDLDPYAFSLPPSPTSSTPATTNSGPNSTDLTALRRDLKLYRHDIKAYQRELASKEAEITKMRQLVHEVEAQLAMNRRLERSVSGGSTSSASHMRRPQQPAYLNLDTNGFGHAFPPAIPENEQFSPSERERQWESAYYTEPRSPVNPAAERREVEGQYREMSLPPVPPPGATGFLPPNIGHFLPPPRDPGAVSGPVLPLVVPNRGPSSPPPATVSGNGRSTPGPVASPASIPLPKSPPPRSTTPLAQILPLSVSRRIKRANSTTSNSSLPSTTLPPTSPPIPPPPRPSSPTTTFPLTPIIPPTLTAVTPLPHSPSPPPSRGLFRATSTSTSSGTSSHRHEKEKPEKEMTKAERKAWKEKKRESMLREFREGYLGDTGGRVKRKPTVKEGKDKGKGKEKGVVSVEEMMRGLEESDRRSASTGNSGERRFRW